MERLSRSQLFVLTVFFQIGTTIIFGFGGAAGKDAWIVTIVSMLLGLGAIGMYLTLMSLNPGLTLVEWFPAQFGKWIGTPIAWFYPLLGLYEAARGLNDVKFVTTTLILYETPYIVIVIFFVLVCAYIQLCGIEVLGRMSEIFFPYLLITIFLTILFVFISDILQMENLQPILKDGWAPILKASFPLGASQGFAQTLELAMIWSIVKASKKDIIKITILGTLFSGLMIFLIVIVIIAGIGEFSYKTENFPMFTLVSKVDIGEVIKNLDIFAVILFIISAFFKISLHMFFAIRGIQILLKINNSRRIIIPITVLSIYLGYSVSWNFQEHLQVALEVFPYNLWILLLWGFPILLLMVTLIKYYAKKRKSEVGTNKER